jgi:threonine/homoserine/homoserine lactone efflux protein
MMQISLFAAGFGLSLFGSLPPGLISLSVSQTAIRRGMAAALLLAAGAAGAEFFQAWAAVALTDWFLSHPSVERWFQWAAVPVFLVLAVYLIFFSKPHVSRAFVAEVSPLKQVGRGVLLSTFNLLAIPYWFAYCGSLRVSGWWSETGLGATLVFSAGVTVGTMAALALYAWLGRIILNHSESMARHADRFVGVIFLGLGLKLLLGLLGG